GFMSVAGNVGIKSGNSFDTINHQDRNVAALEMSSCHHDAQLFRLQLGLSFPADTGRIDETKLQTITFNKAVDSIARCAGDGRHHCPFLANKLVQQRGLADVWAPDDRYPNFASRSLVSLFRCWYRNCNFVQ